MTEYKWKDGIPKPKVDANVFAAEIERLALEIGGPVRPQDVVSAASEHGSPISGLFEWDSEVAAEKYRVTQARHFIGALQVVRVHIEHGPTISSRAFHRVKEGSRGGYVSETRVLGDRDLKKQLIGSASRELQAFINRFQGIAAMGNYLPRLQALTDEMRDHVDRIELDASTRRPHAVRVDEEAARTAA